METRRDETRIDRSVSRKANQPFPTICLQNPKRHGTYHSLTNDRSLILSCWFLPRSFGLRFRVIKSQIW
ncbi:hypothetical protein PGT21_033474 [Puccinia graminis f. sp. tritici]|uniref:Uncharacterized protein n=1 Tax=Puccinia graminis f. sp. tritici TaxID=56615 RepID=A0A5B0Q834_PUCGR|nr:hypothetical protein PGT21_033474 [Puccinia graminis f. sp. tritici]KAA1109390.1 hypothetical protein PGTUg99_031836 [Puccinia graminis f. sp. tritici]